MSTHLLLPPSPWVEAWAPLIPPGGKVLDLACGRGRHARLLAGRGHGVVAVDRDDAALATLAAIPGITTQCVDLESGMWACAGQRFHGIVVTNYLHRPLFAHLIESLHEGGILIYETFALGNERYGRPASPEFLLEPGELLRVTRDKLHVVAYEDRYVALPRPAMVQRICATAAVDSRRVWG